MKKSKLNPLISIIMNCHNGEQFLQSSVKSILNQSYRNFELIFFDNKSTDSSLDIIEKFNDKRIKIFTTNRYHKLYKARNLAISKSKGDYISFLDTDDLFEKDKIKDQVTLIKANKNFDILYSNYYIFNQLKKKKFVKYYYNLPSGFITQKLLNDYCFGILTIMINKKIFKDLKFNEKYDVIGDFDFVIRASQKYKILAIQKPLATYRIHDTNFSTKRLDIYINELKNWLLINSEKLYKKNFNLISLKYFLLKLRIKFIFNYFFKSFSGM